MARVPCDTHARIAAYLAEVPPDDAAPATAGGADGYDARMLGVRAAVAEMADGQRWSVVARLYGPGGGEEEGGEVCSRASWLDEGNRVIAPERQRLLLHALVLVTAGGESVVGGAGRDVVGVDAPSISPMPSSLESARLGPDQWRWLKKKLLRVAARHSRRRMRTLGMRLLTHMWRDADDLILRDESRLELLDMITAQDAALAGEEDYWEALVLLADQVLNAVCTSDDGNAAANDLRRRIMCTFLPALLPGTCKSGPRVSRLISRIYNNNNINSGSALTVESRSILSDLCEVIDADGGVLLSASSNRANTFFRGIAHVCTTGITKKDTDGCRPDEGELRFVVCNEAKTEQKRIIEPQPKRLACCDIGCACMTALLAWLTRLIALHTKAQCEDLFGFSDGKSFPKVSFGWQSGFDMACKSILRFMLAYDDAYGTTRVADWVCSALAEDAGNHAAHALAVTVVLHCTFSSQGGEGDTIVGPVLQSLVSVFDVILSAAEAAALAEPASSLAAHNMWGILLKQIIQKNTARVQWQAAPITTRKSKSHVIDGVRVLLYCAQLPTNARAYRGWNLLLDCLKDAIFVSFPSLSTGAAGTSVSAKTTVVGESITFWSPRLRDQVSCSRLDSPSKAATSGRVGPRGAAQYKEKPSLATKVEWCVLGLCRPYCDTQNLGWALPLVFPMIDDYEAAWQMRGLSLLRHLLSQTGPTAFRFHAGLIYTVLQHSLTSRHEQVPALTLQCLGQCVRMSERRGQEETNPRLHELLSSIVEAIGHAEGARRRSLLEGIVPLIHMTGIQFVRHLPQAFPTLLGILKEGSLPFSRQDEENNDEVDESGGVLLSTVQHGTKAVSPIFRTIMAIIAACWPRMHCHRANIMACACRAVMVSVAATHDAARTLALLCIVSRWRDGEIVHNGCESWMDERFSFLQQAIQKTTTGDVLSRRLARLKEIVHVLLDQEEPAAGLFGRESELMTQGWYCM